MIDYYKALGLTITASVEEIKRAYRHFALKHHPDLNGGNPSSESKFREIKEAYETLSDPERRKKYDILYSLNLKNKSGQKEEKNQDTKGEVNRTPQEILQLFLDTSQKCSGLERTSINQLDIYKSFNELLSNNNLKILASHNDIRINKRIIEEVLTTCASLDIRFRQLLSSRLLILSGTDTESIPKISKFGTKKSYSSSFDYVIIFMLAATLLFVIVHFPQCNSNNKKEPNKENAPENGDLDKTFTNENDKKKNLTKDQKLEQLKDSLKSTGWSEENLSNGQLPNCYNFKPSKGKVDNYLEINVGLGTDVAVKVMNSKTNDCIRYIFINRGSTYKAKNIPEGTYYLKIAYGKDWVSKVINGRCQGQFIKNPLYQKGEDILDFNLIPSEEGYSVPSFKLSLDVKETDVSNSFDSENISESEFNN